jgi:shikimate 5-dehydrogenase
MDIAYFQEEVILRVVRNARAAVMTAGNKFPENVSYNGKLGTDVVYMSYNTKIVKTALIDAAQNIEGVTVL